MFRRPSNASAAELNGTSTVLPSNPSDAPMADSSQYRETPKILRDFRSSIKRGIIPNLNTSSLSAIVDVLRHKESIDDRKLLLEHALSFVSKLEDGPIAQTLQNKIIELLYNDLPHPPSTSVGNKYAWRTADGSFNNIDIPDLGKAGTPYSRSVQQIHPLPSNQLPDPGLVFDTLLRREGFVKHPGGLSSLMFSFAALVIHSVFRTSHRDVNINETSSYVDLAPLYGNSEKDQDRIRVRDGRGLLFPDVFAEDRLLLLPPAVCAILVLFSRNHNYIARKLLEINERGTYDDPAKLQADDAASKAKLVAQEEDIFQTARLVNCGWFGSVVFSDYFSTILGLVRDGSNWSLSPFGEIRRDDHSLFERGKGNVCSVEFNCLYRWHATTSAEDEKWTQAVFGQIFEGKDVATVTVNDFKQAARKAQEMQPDIHHWTFGTLKRQENGYFKDEDLAGLLKNATEHPAGAFRARGTPPVMRLNEIMGIEQNRRWGVCSLNDFRQYLGLKTYKTFLEWNSDPEIADAAEKLYGHIDYLELYVGLQAEEAKPLVDGAGLCPGYTISRAILSDAIALTRGDRFFTHDLTPYNLTAWGFADCQRDPNAFGFGSTLGKLFLRNLPNDFTENSVYAFFPLMLPVEMKTNLKKLDLLDQYDISRPATLTPLQQIKDYNPVSAIISDKAGFSAPYSSRVPRIIQGKGFFTAEAESERIAVINALNSSPESLEKFGQWFYDNTHKLITENSYTLVGGITHGIDLVREVLKPLPVYWVATEIAGIQLKTKHHPHGVYTASDLYDILADIYSFIYLNIDTSSVMVLQQKTKANIQKLLRLIKGNVSASFSNRMSVAGLVESISSLFTKPKKAEYHDIVKRLYELGHSTDQLANSILALMVSSVELSLGLTNMVNLYLGTEKDPEIRLVSNSPEVRSRLDGFVYEALRIDPPFRGVYRVSSKDQTVAGQAFKKDARVFLDISNANLTENVFPNAQAINVSRSRKDYLFTDGIFGTFGETLSVKIMSEVLRAVFAYENLRRAPGQSGTLARFRDDTRPELRFAYLNTAQKISPWARSLSAQYDTK